MCAQCFVLLQRERGISGSEREQSKQLARRWRRSTYAIAGGCKIVEQSEHACRHVEADRVAASPGGAGIVRHQHRDLALAARLSLQADERRDAIRDHRYAIAFRPACQRREAEFVAGR